jgi:hypothetical protein
VAVGPGSEVYSQALSLNTLLMPFCTGALSSYLIPVTDGPVLWWLHLTTCMLAAGISRFMHGSASQCMLLMVLPAAVEHMPRTGCSCRLTLEQHSCLGMLRRGALCLSSGRCMSCRPTDTCMRMLLSIPTRVSYLGSVAECETAAVSCACSIHTSNKFLVCHY